MRMLTLAGIACLTAQQVPVPVPVPLPVPVPSSARAVVSRADLIYKVPAARSEEGIPIGNGRTGTLVWTTPSALKFQINRVDIQPINKDTRSFFERNTDYMGGAGLVDLELAGSGSDVFTADGTNQHLSVYEGRLDVKAAGVNARILAWHERDVIAIEVDDRRTAPEPIQINLRMLRSSSQYAGSAMEQMIADRVVAVRTRDHTAASRIAARDGRILLTQDFEEGTYHAKSAVAIALLGRKTFTRFANETEVRIVSPAERGRVVILIASAAALEARTDVASAALASLDAAAAKSFDDLAGDNAEWWHAFWQQGTIALHSADGVADYVAENYHYYLYLMAATSRGAFPPKFNGMLWNTAGDLRTWGTQHWFANLSCYYEALFAANRIELLDPVFSMYSGMYDSAAVAARQQWGSQGIYIPETVWHDGLAALPDAVAAEMRDLYLLRKPWTERTARFMQFARTGHPHSSRWNWWGGGGWTDAAWVPTERPTAPFGPVSHVLGTTAKVAYLYWRRYEYTQDVAWLRDRAYPMIAGAAEFYRHFPNLRKEADGKYHIHHVNSNESVMGAHDTDEDLSAMRGIFAAAIRASELLGVDTALRARWQEALADLAPLPTSDHPDALRPDDYTGAPVFVRGLKPTANGNTGFTPDGNSLPMWFFDLVNLESPDRQMLAAANETFDRTYRAGIGPTTAVGVLSKWAIAGTTLGRVDATRFLVPNQMRALTAERQTAYLGGRPLANRLTLREGPQALDAQRLGRAAEALQLALMQSAPGVPGGDPVILLFPAWPDEWDALFTLRARGGFLVTAAKRSGRVEFVQLRSESGSVAKMRNPWGAAAPVSLTRNGTRAQVLKEQMLVFDTEPGDVITLRNE
jgi:Glycosyl hydrolase family 95 catalytic domain